MSAAGDFEPVFGLPEELPTGERIVWQGRPEWKAFARHTFKLRWLSLYFAAFAAARLFVALREGQGVAGIVSFILVALLGAACIGILCLLAWVNARAAVYTITNRRIVMRIGVALPTTWNLPFARLASADLTVRDEGDGDIVLRLAPPNRIAWLHLWPHARPWTFAVARPAFRAVAHPARVSALLADTVHAWAAAQGSTVTVNDHKVVAPPVPSPSPVANTEAAAVAGA